MDVPTFRQDFPEFTLAAYPDQQVTFWLSVAVLMVNADRWASTLNLGLELFTAHQLVLEKQAIVVAAAGGIPGLSSGIVSSKSLDKAAITYDVASSLDADAGYWNLTIFGRRYWTMMMMFGAGGMQL